MREEGLASTDIKKKMKEKGFEESQMQYYLKKSDEIFLNQSINNKRFKSNGKSKKGIKMMGLVLCLILLSSVFLDYARIGLFGLSIVWSLIGFSSYRK